MRFSRWIIPAAAGWLSACASQAPAPADTAATPAASVAADDPMAAMYRSWVEPAEPFRVIGNVYYVGTKGLGMYLIATPEGLIVLDGGLPQNADQVLASIRALGFDPGDIKILLNSHAHFDHSGGLAKLKAVSNGDLVASDGDLSALEGGFYLGSEDDHSLDTEPVTVDRLIADGGMVSLGGTTLTARITPGHTRGCTSWWMTAEEAGKPYEVLFFCSATVAANRLAPDPQYEGIVGDYRHTFEITKDWKPDVFLANHPEFAGLWQARARQAAGDPLAFVNPDAFPAYITRMKADFEQKLAEQTAAAAPAN